MADIDPISLGYLLNKKTKLKYPLDYDIFEEVKQNLSSEEIKSIMIDLGEYLGKLHNVSGKKFGPIDPSLLDDYKLVGTYDSWYDFLISNFEKKFVEMDKNLDEEKIIGKHKTNLSEGNRGKMFNILNKKNQFFELLEQNKKILDSVLPKFLNGNVYTKNIIVKGGKFIGLIDFHQAMLGDPVDEL